MQRSILAVAILAACMLLPDPSRSQITPPPGGGGCTGATGSYTSANVTLSGGCVTSASNGSGGGAAGLWGAVLSTLPTQSGTGFTTWLNQPSSSTVANGATGVVVFQPNASSNWTYALVKQTSGTTPVSYTALLANVNTGIIADESSTFPFGASVFGFSDGTKGVVFQMIYDPNTTDNGTGWKIAVAHNSGLSNATSTDVVSLVHCMNPQWAKIKDDGTNLLFYISYDGATWLLLHSEARTSYLSAVADVVFGNGAYNADTNSTLMSWAQGS